MGRCVGQGESGDGGHQISQNKPNKPNEQIREKPKVTVTATVEQVNTF
jgi:hypothetical protein|tara:strand:+ start:281 stop:424 length:144 start_codon:yes stop_codon:yes gene_type:complete